MILSSPIQPNRPNIRRANQGRPSRPASSQYSSRRPNTSSSYTRFYRAPNSSNSAHQHATTGQQHTPVHRSVDSGQATRTVPRRAPLRNNINRSSVHPQSNRPSGNWRQGRGSTHGRGSAASARTIQKLKQNSVYSLEINDQYRQILNSIPSLADGDIRIVPVCGLEWVGTNMMFIEYKDEIVVIDVGIGFTKPNMPGIDNTIPNTAYLKMNCHKIKALVITHGHLDHVGAISYVIEDLGFPPIYTREFGAVFIKKKMEEFPQLAKKIKIETIEADMGYVPISGNMKVRFFGLTHSIPDSTGVIIQTPLGGILNTGDVRIENENGIIAQKEIDQYEFLKDENILLASIDSTGIEKPGWGISESGVQKNIDAIIKASNGRLFISAFASQVERLISFIESAKRYGKYVSFEGRSMKNNMAITKELKLTDFGHVVPIEEIDDYPPNKMVIILTGGQCEEFSALNRIANGTHKSISLQKDDTILLSSSIVPGNDFPVTQLKNNLYCGSYNVITYSDNAVHASGHGRHEELKWIHQQIHYRFFMPVHGDSYMIRLHAKMAIQELHVPEDRVMVCDNGSIVEIRNNGDIAVKLAEKIPSDVTVIDGAYLGPLHKVVIDDRTALAEDGMFVVVVSIDTKTGRLKKSPDIISRGFIYLRESKELLSKVRGVIKRVVESHATKRQHVDFDEIKNVLTEHIGKYLLQETHKEPIVIPVVLGM